MIHWISTYWIALLLLLSGWGGGTHLRNRRLSEALAELEAWYRTTVRISVGGPTFITFSLEELRSQALDNAWEEGKQIDFDNPPATLPPLVIGRQVLITVQGQGWHVADCVGLGGEPTAVILTMQGIPFPRRSELGHDRVEGW
jgi:hypothetical protein